MTSLKTSLVVAAASIAAILATNPANAESLPNVGLLNQSQFNALAADLGSAFSIGGVTAHATVNVSGVRFGVGLGVADFGNSGIWRSAWRNSSVPSPIVVSKWRATIALTNTLDLSGQYSIAHATSLRSIGTDLNLRLVPETQSAPGVSAGLSLTHLLGTDTVKSNTLGVNLGISKTLGVITPYGGIGRVWARTRASGTALRSASTQQTRFYGGVRLNAFFALALEAERVGDSTNYAVRYGLQF